MENKLFDTKPLNRLAPEIRESVQTIVGVFHDMFSKIPKIDECIVVAKTAKKQFTKAQQTDDVSYLGLSVEDAIKNALSLHLGLPTSGGGSYSPGSNFGPSAKKGQVKGKTIGSGHNS